MVSLVTVGEYRGIATDLKQLFFWALKHTVRLRLSDRQRKTFQPIPNREGFGYRVYQKSPFKVIAIADLSKNQIVGALQLKQEHETYPNCWESRYVTVLPEYRGKGLGFALYEIALMTEKMILISSDAQTKLGLKMWRVIATTPFVSTYAIAKKDHVLDIEKKTERKVPQKSLYNNRNVIFPLKRAFITDESVRFIAFPLPY